jgi:hypothetical protein
MHSPRISGDPRGSFGTLLERWDAIAATAVWKLAVPRKETTMGLLLLILLVVLALGAVPAWPYSRSWGYGPSGGLGLIVLIVLVLVLTGKL